MDTLDLVIVGAGLSGINVAHHVSRQFPHWRWQLLEGRDDLGGTWHTFRYPGIRSDSDMATFAFPFRPWTGESTLGSGEDIKEYLRDTAAEDGTLEHLRTDAFVENVNWDSAQQLWEVTLRGGEQILTRRVHLATGYYDHDNGYRPTFPQEETFTRPIIHPQNWPEDLDVTGKNIVVVGSGATAVTLIPALADAGAQVTMLQRSPTWIAPLAEVDHISAVWRRVLPKMPAHRAARMTHAVRDELQYLLSQHTPWAARRFFRTLQRRHLPAEVLDQHFTPDYKPWDQRVCKAPDGDIFDAIADGRATVVTDRINRFTETGIELSRGNVLPADIIVTATGLELLAFGGATISIDGHVANPSDLVTYRGTLFAGIPNLSFTVGYLNASWTLRSDLTAQYLIRLWQKSDLFTPVAPDGQTLTSLMEFDSGYIRRGQHRLPRQGDAAPWRYEQNYLTERAQFTGRRAFDDIVYGPDALQAVNKPAFVARSISNSDRFRPTDLSGLPATRLIDVEGRRIRMRVSEPKVPDAKTVVMIHGIGRSLEDFDDQVALWGDKARLIAVDIPGFGLSDRAVTEKLADVAELLWRTVDAVVGEAVVGDGDGADAGVHLLGNSLGGALSMELTAQRPQRVASVGLISPASFGEKATPLLRLVTLPKVGAASIRLSGLRAMYEPVEHLILRRPGAVTKHRLDVAREVGAHAARPETYYQFCRGLGTFTGILPEWREELQRRFVDALDDKKVFLCWGREDKILPFVDFSAAVETLKPETAVVFENCGHMPQLEYPAELAEQYQEFLGRVG